MVKNMEKKTGRSGMDNSPILIDIEIGISNLAKKKKKKIHGRNFKSLFMSSR